MNASEFTKFAMIPSGISCVFIQFPEGGGGMERMVGGETFGRKAADATNPRPMTCAHLRSELSLPAVSYLFNFKKDKEKKECDY
jgi:hypothetical protein